MENVSTFGFVGEYVVSEERKEGSPDDNGERRQKNAVKKPRQFDLATMFEETHRVAAERNAERGLRSSFQDSLISPHEKEESTEISEVSDPADPLPLWLIKVFLYFMNYTQSKLPLYCRF